MNQMPVGVSPLSVGADVAVPAGTVVTANGNSAPVTDLGAASTLSCYLVVSAASGTAPTLDVDVQDSPDGVNWYTVKSFAQSVAAGQKRIDLLAGTPFADAIRFRYTVGGTAPSFTIGILCVAKADPRASAAQRPID